MITLDAASQPESVASQLERMLVRRPLVSSPSLRRLLRFLVEETLAGRGESITEPLLGVRVFNRGEEFDPRTDPIVRVQAHHLRARLAGYYAGPGAADPLRIELPGRTYIPVFRTLPQPATPPVEPAALTQPPIPKSLRGSVLVAAVAAFLSVTGLATLWRAYISPQRLAAGALLQRSAPAVNPPVEPNIPPECSPSPARSAPVNSR